MKKVLPSKHIFLFLSSCFLLLTSDAQWSYDPENPQLVSDETCVQQNVQQVADDNGGTIVFWLDSRSGCNGNTFNDIYGQYYDANGTELWEEGGREILSYTSSIVSFAVMRQSSQEGIIVGAHSRGIGAATDSLRFQKLNDDGEQLWANDLLAAKSDGCEGNYFLGIENFSFIKNGNGYTVNFVPTYCGGADGCRITHFTTDGVLTGAFNGEPEGNQYYIGSRGIDNTYDGSNDTYLYYTGGNGTGAHAFVMRVTEAGDSAFAPVDVLEGTNGLNYQFAAMSDEDGIAVCYQSTGENGYVDLFIRKLNSNGTWAWNGDIKHVCVADGSQGNFHWVQDETYYYIVWADGRPGVIGNYAIYAQKIEKATGEMQWQQDGIVVFDQNTYLPYPKCVLTNQGKLIVTNEATWEFGFNAQTVNPDGTLDWPATSAIASFPLSPFYADYTLLKSSDNIIVAWSKVYSGGGADGIYISTIEAPAVFLEETISACDSYTSNGETFTSSGVYVQQLPGDTTLVLNLTINTADISLSINGNTLEALTNEGFIYWINCADNSIVLDDSQTFTPEVSGEYALMVSNEACQDTSDCYLIEIIGIDELIALPLISLFPNPGDEVLNMKTAYPLKNSVLTVTDAVGRALMIRMNLSGSNFSFDMNDCEDGVYLIELISEGKSSKMKWIKSK
jgi:hypothetical protein